LAANWNSQQSNLNGNGTGQMYSQYWDQLNSVLTPQQQQTWAQLTGERFNFGNAGAGTGNVIGSAGTGTSATNGTVGGGTGGAGTGTAPPDTRNNLTAPRPNTGLHPLGEAGDETSSGTSGSGTTGTSSNGTATSAGTTGSNSGSTNNTG